MQPLGKRRKGPSKCVPVTVLTGFLGSGKTTLLNHILSDRSHGMKFAVIENELGEIGIDQKIISERVDESIIEVMNGCICCKTRGDLVDTLKRLYQRVETFDGIIIETTGLADPTPVVQTFFAETNNGEEALEKMYKLDSIITVADAKYILQRLDEDRPCYAENEAELQVCFADKILLNKTDLVGEEEKLREIEDRLHSLNPNAPILRCQHSKVTPKELLNIGAFDLERVLEFDPFFLGEFKQPKHDRAISSLSTKVEGEVNLQLLDNWISRLLQDVGDTLYRYKGIIAVKGMQQPFVFQGVGRLFSGAFRGNWKADERRESTFVFIGKDLNTMFLRAGFKACRETKVLRFPLGTIVDANTGIYERGTVIRHWHDGHAYLVRLHDRIGEILVPVDIDWYVCAVPYIPQREF